MGARGPVPKRAEERAGHRAKADKPDSIQVAGKVRVPAVDKEWQKPAKDWYRSLRTSGQSLFFEPSDWRYAWILAELLSDELSKNRRSSEMIKAILVGMDNLGTTEGARRRLRIEVDRDPGDSVPDGAKVAVMARYRSLGGGAEAAEDA